MFSYVNRIWCMFFLLNRSIIVSQFFVRVHRTNYVTAFVGLVGIHSIFHLLSCDYVCSDECWRDAELGIATRFVDCQLVNMTMALLFATAFSCRTVLSMPMSHRNHATFVRCCFSSFQTIFRPSTRTFLCPLFVGDNAIIHWMRRYSPLSLPLLIAEGIITQHHCRHWKVRSSSISILFRFIDFLSLH